MKINFSQTAHWGNTFSFLEHQVISWETRFHLIASNIVNNSAKTTRLTNSILASFAVTASVDARLHSRI